MFNWKMITAALVACFALAACGDKGGDTGDTSANTHNVEAAR